MAGQCSRRSRRGTSVPRQDARISVWLIRAQMARNLSRASERRSALPAQIPDADVPPAPEAARLPAHAAAVNLDGDRSLDHAVQRVVLRVGGIADLDAVDPHDGARHVPLDPDADAVP